MRRRRPLMRMAGAAALGTVAYQSGKRHNQQTDVDDESQRAYAATQGPAPVDAVPAPPNITDELERLAKLHQESSLTEAEFSAAKATLLGI